MWHHPKYYKELRKRNKSDQVISEAKATAASERAPGQGLKHQAIEETVPHNDIEEAQASSTKLQASSKPEPVQVQEASSAKRQASQSE
jgi:hypothetical protein